jgi:hypothetical protein
MNARRWAQGAGLCLLSFAIASALAAQALRIEEIGGEPVPVPGIGNAELSGITWAGGARYLAVDDGRSRLFPLDVTIDEATGKIVRVVAGEFVSLKGARDIEGIAWRSAQHSVIVTDETAHELREYDPVSGELKRSFPPPALFHDRIRQNRGFEGVAISPDGKSVWTVNEGPLRYDGDSAGALQGAWVRLQRFDAALVPNGQWAYRTEPGIGFVGVVDLMVAPAGELLVLERALTGGGFSARIFFAGLARATDIAGIERLRDRDDFRPARKEKLWERTGGFQNFEGIALGPELAGGARLVLLVSDGGDQRPPTLLPLRFTTRPAEPSEPPTRDSNGAAP